MNNPTVYIVIAGEACAFEERGDIITTFEWTPDGKPVWENGAVADHRGAGGQVGFDALHAALSRGEWNAGLCGLDVVRLPS